MQHLNLNILSSLHAEERHDVRSRSNGKQQQTLSAIHFELILTKHDFNLLTFIMVSVVDC